MDIYAKLINMHIIYIPSCITLNTIMRCFNSWL